MFINTCLFSKNNTGKYSRKDRDKSLEQGKSYFKYQASKPRKI